MPKDLENHPKIYHSIRLGDLKRILGVAPKVGEKGVALKVNETGFQKDNY